MANGALEVFGLGLDQLARYVRVDNAGLFSGGFNVGPAGTFTSLAAAAVFGNDVVLFGVGTDGQVRRAGFNETTAAPASGFLATAPGNFTRISATGMFNFVELDGLSGAQVFVALFNPNGTLNSGFFPTAAGTFSRVAVK